MQAQGGHDVVTYSRSSRCRKRHEWHAVEGLAQLPQASIVQPEVVAPCASSAPAWPWTMQGDYLTGTRLNKSRNAGQQPLLLANQVAHTR